MRVTTNMLGINFLRDLNSRLEQIAKRQEELSSGRRLNRPSDDPLGVMGALRLRAQLAENRQYHKNMADAVDWLNTTESALRDALATVQRARELAVAGANSDLPPGALQALSQEVEQLQQHLVDVANTSYAGRYIFAGTQTDRPPCYQSGNDSQGNPIYNWQGNSGIISYEIAPSTTVQVNVSGIDIFPAMVNSLAELRNALQSGQVTIVSSKCLQELDQHMDSLLGILSRVGAKVKRLEMGMERLESNEADLTRLLSQTEDADMARTIVSLKTQENVYRAALAVGARLLQPSLVDFLR
ncbi:flagellar hook-associated protein FlgL [Desulfothermobacter acidiphilus]|uniref:flagellar hook-associated protein FlgL n=1 Tax=Desulfothermobacter acidiphilus TaxID=1938353 RepID=UPI003F8AD7D1